jgi:acyl-CoA synthetase (AMP-forming)/AMP-acid ligase II
MNIALVLSGRARERPDRRALVDVSRSLTFGALEREVSQAAVSLVRAGLRAGDRALVFCPMSIDLYVTLIAIFRIGAVAVFIDPSAGRRQLSTCCATLKPRAFVASPRAHLLRLLSPGIRQVALKFAIGGGVPGAFSIAGKDDVARGDAETVEPRRPEDPALITFTSGSTGEAKAAVRTHGFLLAQHRVLARDLQLTAGDVDLTTLPIFVLANLASGVCSVIAHADLREPSNADPARLLRQIREEQACRMAASPALLGRLAAHVADRGERLAARRIFTGGGPVFPVMLDAIASAAPGAEVTAIYGSTEAEPIASLRRAGISDSDRALVRGGAGVLAGLPVPDIDLRVIPDSWGTPLGPFDEAGIDRLALPQGQPGEVVVAGDHVLGGYLDGRGDGESKVRAGARVWHRTGDAGYLDAGGRLWLLGRCAARVADPLGTVYPLAVEAAVSDVPGVIRTAFVRRRGRRVLVAELAGPRPRAAIESLRTRLHWVHLDDVLVVERIPVDRRHNAKIDYPALERLLEQRAA